MAMLCNQQKKKKKKKKKKSKNKQHIKKVEKGTFKPMVFSIYGGMGRECQDFYSKLS